MTNFEVYFRDKELRSEQNRRAYRKRVGRHLRKGTVHQSPPPTRRGLDPHTSSVPVLPPALITHATMRLPTSAMFLEAAQSADALDESELPSWEEDPPYNAESDSTPEEERFTRNLVDVMLGRRSRLSDEMKAERAKRFEKRDLDLFTELVHSIKERMVRWFTVYDIVQASVESSRRHNRMAACWLHWQARDIHRITEEALELEIGGNPYDNSAL